MDTSFFEARRIADDNKRPAEVRTEFERDRARIIHSAAFRRLQGKTQVMGVGEGDFHRTRLTHTIECAQIGAGILDQLLRDKRVPSDFDPWFPRKEFIEAVCFAHDLGHPPFGHGGEMALFGEMRNCGGFEGNAHTLRILGRLEKHRIPDAGINPTRRLVLAVLKYPRAYSRFNLSHGSFERKPPKCFFDDEIGLVEWALSGFADADRFAIEEIDPKQKPKHRTFDCSVMELADDIAYGIHDIEDIVARRLSTKDEVFKELTAAFHKIDDVLKTPAGDLTSELVAEALFNRSFDRKQMIGRLVNTFMTEATVATNPEFSHPLLRYRVALPERHRILLESIRGMSHSLVINKPAVQQLERRGKRVVSKLFRALSEDPSRLIHKFDIDESTKRSPAARQVCDYVAGMTDSYAEKIYRRLFVPGFGTSHDEL